MAVGKPSDDRKQKGHPQTDVQIEGSQHQEKNKRKSIEVNAVVDEILALHRQHHHRHSKEADFPHPQFEEELAGDVLTCMDVAAEDGPQDQQQHHDQSVGTVARGDAFHSKRFAEQKEEGQHGEQQPEQLLFKPSRGLRHHHDGEHKPNLVERRPGFDGIGFILGWPATCSKIRNHATQADLTGAFDQRQAVQHGRNEQQHFGVCALAKGQAARGREHRRHQHGHRALVRHRGELGHVAGRQFPKVDLPHDEGQERHNPPEHGAFAQQIRKGRGDDNEGDDGHWSEGRQESALFAEEGQHEQGCGNDAWQHLVRDLSSTQQLGVHERPSNHC